MTAFKQTWSEREQTLPQSNSASTVLNPFEVSQQHSQVSPTRLSGPGHHRPGSAEGSARSCAPCRQQAAAGLRGSSNGVMGALQHRSISWARSSGTGTRKAAQELELGKQKGGPEGRGSFLASETGSTADCLFSLVFVLCGSRQSPTACTLHKSRPAPTLSQPHVPRNTTAATPQVKSSLADLKATPTFVTKEGIVSVRWRNTRHALAISGRAAAPRSFQSPKAPGPRRAARPQPCHVSGQPPRAAQSRRDTRPAPPPASATCHSGGARPLPRRVPAPSPCWWARSGAA